MVERWYSLKLSLLFIKWLISPEKKKKNYSQSIETVLSSLLLLSVWVPVEMRAQNKCEEILPGLRNGISLSRKRLRNLLTLLLKHKKIKLRSVYITYFVEKYLLKEAFWQIKFILNQNYFKKLRSPESKPCERVWRCGEGRGKLKDNFSILSSLLT